MEREIAGGLTKEGIGVMDEEALIEGAKHLFEMDDIQRALYEALMRLRAKKLGIGDILDKVIKRYQATVRKYDSYANKTIADIERKEAEANNRIGLELDERGNPLVSIENNLRVLRGDPKFAPIRYNLLRDAPEWVDESGKARLWTDTDDAQSICYIEKTYGLYGKEKFMLALLVLFKERAYHPVRELLEGIQWDGEPRVDTFLMRWMRCEDTPYTREVSRLIFAGGIRRLYEPGCKFDYMAVLIGTRQGEGKSTLVRWLAMEDRFFREVSVMEGQKGMEALDGAWICEVGELLALTRAREQEAIKAYMTRQTDTHRRPYARRISDSERQCILIGTTNKQEFLKDKTGGRRFLPVRVHQRGYVLFASEAEVRADIAQCWAEARERMLKGEMPTFADASLTASIEGMQRYAQEDDYRIGLIAEYLRDKDQVCGIEIWEKALHNTFARMTKRDEQDIGMIMQGFPEWERSGRRVHIPQYGQQRVWVRKVSVWADPVLEAVS